MGACGTCQHNPAPSPIPPELCQIRRGFRAQWSGLVFSAETESCDWTVRVQESAGGETLYTAHRGGAGAARLAAVEFAVYRLLGFDSRVSPDHLAKELNWQEYW